MFVWRLRRLSKKSTSKSTVTKSVQVISSCCSPGYWVRHPLGTTWQDSTHILASRAAGSHEWLSSKYLSCKAENDQCHRRQVTTEPEDG